VTPVGEKHGAAQEGDEQRDHAQGARVARARRRRG
jgi:hypothetical protein